VNRAAQPDGLHIHYGANGARDPSLDYEESGIRVARPWRPQCILIACRFLLAVPVVMSSGATSLAVFIATANIYGLYDYTTKGGTLVEIRQVLSRHQALDFGWRGILCKASEDAFRVESKS
jgi:hypothetical protein